MSFEDVKATTGRVLGVDFGEARTGLAISDASRLLASGLGNVRGGGLEKTAELARDEGFDYFCTTLSISPLKNSQKINEIGFELEKEYGVKWLPSDFKKNEGYKRSIELSREYNLYRQNFCGCVYSNNEEKVDE